MEVNINLPKTARGEKTLEKIYLAAETLFDEKGFHQTTMGEIALKAGVALGTLYIYFKDKLSLYIYILQRYSHEIRKVSAKASQQYKSRYDQEFYGLKAWLQYIIKHRGAYRIIMETQYVCPEYFQEYYENFAKRYHKWLKIAQDDGEIIDCDLIAASYLLMGIHTFWGMKLSVFDQVRKVDDSDVEKIMKILKNGLFTDKET